VIERIVRSADFQRVLGTPTRARSVHFAVHYLASVPTRPARPKRLADVELSTGEAPSGGTPVDDLAPNGVWLGTVVPKKHARRSVTRSLLKRQIREAVKRQAPLARGLWVVRLRSPFDKKTFASAASPALCEVAAHELETVLADAVRRVGG
jgi:ribonuclease P protein component